MMHYSVTVLLADLWWFHVEYFGNSSLHDEEVRVIDIKLNRAEQILHSRVISITAIDHVFVSSSNNNLKEYKKQIKMLRLNLITEVHSERHRLVIHTSLKNELQSL